MKILFLDPKEFEENTIEFFEKLKTYIDVNELPQFYSEENYVINYHRTDNEKFLSAIKQ